MLKGDVIRWEQQLRFRHLATRQYLCITTDRRVTLTLDSRDPRTVFRLHPVIKVCAKKNYMNLHRFCNIIFKMIVEYQIDNIK